MTTVQLVQMMQASIAPCMLISGTGLLLLVLSNRLLRPIDRARHLYGLMKTHPAEKPLYEKQIKIYYQRCHLLRNSFACSVICMVATAMVMLLLFLSNLFGFNLSVPISICFIAGLLGLIVSLYLLLNDIFITLKSFEIEISHSRE